MAGDDPVYAGDDFMCRSARNDRRKCILGAGNLVDNQIREFQGGYMLEIGVLGKFITLGVGAAIIRHASYER
jgi:hypothetical protein